MTQRVERPSEVVARRIKAECQRQEITIARLAERCAELGTPGLTRDAIASIVSGRRRVDVDELYALGAALNVSPLLLTLPLGSNARLAVTPKLKVGAQQALEWTVGDGPLPNTDRRSSRIEPWPKANWAQAAQPLYLYEKLRELQNEARRALPGVGQTWRDDTQRERARAALGRLREHVEYMQHAGLDETKFVADYEQALAEIEER
jgi:transcriptional regulator with XRE-family HTH domain